MLYIPKDQIVWKQVPYLRQGETRNYDYTLWLNEPLASWDVWDYWERERIESMREHLKKGDILFDIGTEQGWCNLVYAKMVGPENMVLIEPTPEFWPNIQALWEKNYPSIKPLACLNALASDKTRNAYSPSVVFPKNMWPGESEGDIIDRNSYKYIAQDGDTIPQIKIDDYVELSGIVPAALTMDTEGAELLILKGAEKTLRNYKLKVWVSEHDDLSKRDYDIDPDDIKNYMAGLGYSGEILSTDHERHVYYSKK